MSLKSKCGIYNTIQYNTIQYNSYLYSARYKLTKGA